MAHIETRHGRIRPATPFDVAQLAQVARVEDRREVEDISGQSLFLNLSLALSFAQPCLTCRTAFGGLLLGIFGIVPVAPRQGAIAFIGTQAIEQHKTAFLRGAKDVMAHVENEANYGFLYNVVDARNELHIKFLKWLGFTFIRRVDGFGAAKIPVIEFCKIIKP